MRDMVRSYIEFQNSNILTIMLLMRRWLTRRQRQSRRIKNKETVKKDEKKKISKDLEDGLFKLTHEYDMMRLRESMRKERQYMQKLTSYTGKDSF